jgi:hypothetical protein
VRARVRAVTFCSLSCAISFSFASTSLSHASGRSTACARLQHTTKHARSKLVDPLLVLFLELFGPRLRLFLQLLPRRFDLR